VPLWCCGRTLRHPVILFAFHPCVECRRLCCMQGRCGVTGLKGCDYRETYHDTGFVDEQALRSAFGPQLKEVIFVDHDIEFQRRVRELQMRLEPKFPASHKNIDPNWPDFQWGSVMRQVVHHLQPVLVFERFFERRSDARTALFSIQRQDLMMFKVGPAHAMRRCTTGVFLAPDSPCVHLVGRRSTTPWPVSTSA
jgi:hypothetical protein